MKTKNILLILFSLLVLAGLFYYLVYPAFVVVEKNEEIPEEFDVKNPEMLKDLKEVSMNEEISENLKSILEGTFNPEAHDVKGGVLILEADNKKILRFVDFETINGPDLHIYLSADKTNDDFIDLGSIKATKGNVNYVLSENIDLNKYNHVLVYCVPFKVLFSYAVLE